ncbi:LAQU0S01e11518g1_1 [Lachancea quebecensis]|uniref:LAQU0S01e11518g1_1 n=1 Tax=Lachancea quebecensis TaxID=1654605 RepID=A0A0P1KMH7_9SACH|nr:LAQU0S01e11518g1_1 [Lachancea quebecensis]
MPLKHLPIQPATVSIAPNPHPHAGARDARKPGGAGLVIRTSRQWVLPPRPKPGRKPSVDPAAGSRAGAHKTMAAPAKPEPKPIQQVQQVQQVQQPASAQSALTGQGVTSVANAAPRRASATSSAAAAPPSTPATAHTAARRASPAPPVSPRSQDPALAPQPKKRSSVSASGTGSGTGTTPAPSTSIAAATVKKPTKTALKKEIQQLKLENFKLKQELGQLAGNLQDLKHRYSLCDTSAKTCPTFPKKRSFLDSLVDAEFDSTDSFLKFEDDDEDTGHPLIQGVCMKPTMSFSSQYSTRTNLTDDEDPGFSSSTPSSLFSAELQRSVTNTSFAGGSSAGGSGGCGNASGLATSYHCMHSSTSATSPHHHTSSPCNVAGVKLAAASIDTAKFLDDYEQSVFQNKHRHLLEQDTRTKSVAATASAKDQLYGASTASAMTPTFTGDLHLDAIKEEDLNFKLDHDFGNDDISILNFLEDNSQEGGAATTTTATAVTDHIPPWVVKEEEQAADVNLFQDFDTSPALPKPDFHIPPSLEELMGDAEHSERHLDNEIKREDDDSLLKMDVFEFA